MIWSPVAAVVRTCVRAVRRATPKPLTGLTMQQASALLAPRPRIVRRAIAIGCPAAVLPTVAVPPVPGAALAPLPAMPGAVPTPLPFGIGTGPLLPSAFGAPPAFPSTPVYDTIAQAPAGVPEPGALAILAVALAMFAAVLTWRRA